MILSYRFWTLASNLGSLLCPPRYFYKVSTELGVLLFFSFSDPILKSTHSSLGSSLQNLFLVLSSVYLLKNWVYQNASLLP